MPDTSLLITVCAIFLLAGTVKGVIGFGLPSVSLALLVLVVPLPQAMALLLVPSFITNLWQALAGGHGLTLLRRLWPFLLLATATVWLGAGVLSWASLAGLSLLLGALLMVYAGVNLAAPRFAIGARRERAAGVVAGVLNGVFTGMTGSFVVPGVWYLQALGLTRTALLQAMGQLFTLSTLALAAALQGYGLLSLPLGQLSLAALIPALAGMVLGQRLGRRLSEAQFRRVFFIALLLLGTWIALRALSALR